MMFNQFHDILPGSAIKEVYADVDKDHEIIRTGLKNILNDSLKTISSSINTAGEGTPVIIFNPLSWDRMGLVKVPLSELGINEPVTIKDSSGIEIPSQVIEEDGKKLIFVAQNIPSLGYAEYRAIPSKDGSIPSTSLTATSSVLENELFKVEVDPLTGWIKTIFDKTASREVLDGKGKGNSLQLFKDDPPDYAAWSLDENIQKNKFSEPPVKGMEITVVEKGPVRSILRVKHIYKKSVFTQDIILYHKIQIIDFCTRVDWNQKYTCLKAAFPSSISNTFATYEIPYGFIERKLSNAPGATERDSQKWEVNAQQWIDYTDSAGSYGLSLLNNSKYGFDVRDNFIRITLLRAPDHPIPYDATYAPMITDQGKHEISYALYPHTGDWKKALTSKRAYEYNYPLVCRVEAVHNGTLNKALSFISVSPENIILSAMKKSEDGKSFVLRLYETAGKDATAVIKFSKPVAAAFVSDILENEKNKLGVAAPGTSISLPVAHNEIVTLRLNFQK
jgi:alpha-mannosidase